MLSFYLTVRASFAQSFEPDSVVRLTSSEFEDFSAVPYSEKLVFVSGRNTPKKGKIPSVNNQGYFDLFELELVTGETKPLRALGLKQSRFNYGPITFLDEGRGAFYSFNRRRAKKGEFKFTIQYLDFNSGESQKLPFVSKKYNYQHPFYDKENRRLYFASDMPGGKGGYDIYYVQINANGTIGEPVNVREVNTDKNEVFPTSFGSEVYFSTMVPENGLDIFHYSSNEKTVRRLEVPFNSSGDDHSLVYLSSDSVVFTQGIKGRFNSDIFLAYEESADTVFENVELPLFAHQTQDTSGVLSNDSLLASNKISVEQTDIAALEYEQATTTALAEGVESADSSATQGDANLDVDVHSQDSQNIALATSAALDEADKETVSSGASQEVMLNSSIGKSQEEILMVKSSESNGFEQDSSGSRLVNEASAGNTSEEINDEALATAEATHAVLTDPLEIASSSAPIDEFEKVTDTSRAQEDEKGLLSVSQGEILSSVDVNSKEIESRHEISSVVSSNEKKESDEYVSSSTSDNVKNGLKKRTITLEYSSGQLQLTEKQSEYLKEVISKDAVESLLIEGHTDSKGRRSVNNKIALFRAQDIRDALVSEIGIPEQRMSIISWGEQKQKIVCRNCTEEQSRQNRRVEITLFERAVSKVESSNNAVVHVEPVYATYRFTKDQVALKYERRAELKELIEKVPFDKVSVKLVVHTDGVGNKSVNENLSVLRAAELQYLVKKSLGDAIAEIEIEMVANEKPFATIGGSQSDNELLADENRRIDLRITPYSVDANVKREPLVIFFDFDQRSYQRAYSKQIQDFSESLKNNEDVVLIGYADDRGEEGYNFILSLERALSVQKRILSVNPQYTGTVKIVARGESFSGDAKSRAEHARNRKVELFKSRSHE